MLNLLKKLTEASGKREIYTTNLSSLIFSILGILLNFCLIYLFGWSPTMYFAFAVPVLFGLVILLNKQGYVNAGRMLFCIMPVFLIFVIAIWDKILLPNQSFLVYFDTRFLLLASAILPAVVFDVQERMQFWICIAWSSLLLLLYDPIHDWFHVGFYQRGFAADSYYYINYFIFISYAIIVSGVLILKGRHSQAQIEMLKALNENKKFNVDLNERNRELTHLTHEMEAQNEEILQQQEEMTTNQEMLAEANAVISEQKSKLEQYNLQLEKLVEEKSGDLAKTNEELIQSNNELRQFSFTVSHNLRGPVARLLGLTSLIDSLKAEEFPRIAKYIQQSSSELDSILRDLSTIIDIRSELYRVREKIDLEEEWNKARSLIGQNAFDNVQVEIDFESAPYIFGIRPMVQSILFNLISNSLKYKSPDRKLHIQGRSWAFLEQTMVEIRDNGLGFDMAAQKDNVFKLYKRFHAHVAGKGLGLYLVRSQIEIMNGRVEVVSAPDQGTTFRLAFPVPADLDKQVFFENPSARLYYDAMINNTFIIWKKNVTSSEYRQAFETVLLTLKKYNTPGWIADLRNQGAILPEDQKWFVENVLSVAASNGLKRIGTVGFNDPVRKDYYERMWNMTKEFNIELRVFTELESAILWMSSFN
jgi:signal transduction histidine kinase